MSNTVDLNEYLKNKTILHSNCNCYDDALRLLIVNDNVDIVSSDASKTFFLDDSNTVKDDDRFIFKCKLPSDADIIVIDSIYTDPHKAVEIEYIVNGNNVGYVSKLPICGRSIVMRLTFVSNISDIRLNINMKKMVLNPATRQFMVQNKIIIDGVIL
jgi:hypothetical protein